MLEIEQVERPQRGTETMGQPSNESSLESSNDDDVVVCSFRNHRIVEESKEALPGWYVRGTLRSHGNQGN